MRGEFKNNQKKIGCATWIGKTSHSGYLAVKCVALKWGLGELDSSGCGDGPLAISCTNGNNFFGFTSQSICLTSQSIYLTSQSIVSQSIASQSVASQSVASQSVASQSICLTVYCLTVYLPHSLFALQSICLTVYLPHSLFASQSIGLTVYCLIVYCLTVYLPHSLLPQSLLPHSLLPRSLFASQSFCSESSLSVFNLPLLHSVIEVTNISMYLSVPTLPLHILCLCSWLGVVLLTEKPLFLVDIVGYNTV
jgi:hypothetical protein